jgi:hypothetical protein
VEYQEEIFFDPWKNLWQFDETSTSASTSMQTTSESDSPTSSVENQVITLNIKIKTSTTATPTNANTQRGSSMMDKLIIPIGAGAGGFIVLVVIGISVYYVRRRRVANHKAEQYMTATKLMSNSSNLTATVTATTMVSTAMMNTAMAAKVATLVTTQRELTVPGFLEYEPERDFIKIKQLAKGGGGSVHIGKATHPELMPKAVNGKIIVKVVDIPENPTQEIIDDFRMAFDQEVALMWFFNNQKNFAQLLGFNARHWIILMRFYELGSLHGFIHEQDKNEKLQSIPYNSHIARLLGADVAEGMRFMHDNGFVHCDIKGKSSRLILAF